MELMSYSLEIFADSENTIDRSRVDALLADADRVGGEMSPLEYVEPINGGDPRGWGLRIRVTNGDDL